MAFGWPENPGNLQVGALAWARAVILAGLAMAATLGAAPDLAAVRAAAERGDPQAQYELGKAHQFTNDAEAIAWWRKAAEQGHAEAHLSLSVAYLMGRGVPKDQAEGVAWLRKAAERGHAGAQYNLGLGYEFGSMTLPRDLFFAVDWFSRAAAQGHAESKERLAEYPDHVAFLDDAEKLFTLGVSYIPALRDVDNLDNVEVVNGTDGSEESAVWWRKAAEKGHVDAQLALGQYLLARRDVEANVWFENAAEQGHAEAQYLMSRWYWSVEHLGKGIAYLRKAAEQGHAQAQCRLGLAYWIGKGVRRDRVHSYAWFNLGSRGGLTAGEDCSSELLNIADDFLSTEEISEAQSLSRELAERIEKTRGSPQDQRDPDVPVRR